MRLIRSNYLQIIPSSKFEEIRIEQFLKQHCIHKNPAFEKQARFVKNLIFSKVDKYIKTYNKVQKFEKVYFEVMKGNKFIFEEIQKIGLKVDDYRDERIISKADINATAEPRDEEQRKAIKTILDNDFNYGLLEASPAMGKTFCSLYCASKLKQKTLILVDMTLLMDQFIESILKFTDVKENEIGFIRSQEKDYKNKKIVLATIQTLTKKENQDIVDYLSDNIGFVICDEVHIMSCQTAQNILKYLKPRYMLGLSGTPHRDDGLEFVITEAIGPIIHKSDRQAMVEAGSMLTPILRPIFLKDDDLFKKYNVDNEIDFRDVVDMYYNSPKAIDKISNLIIHHYKKNDSQLVICKEMELIDRYYGILIKKLFDPDIEEKAEGQRQRKALQLENEIQRYTYGFTALDMATKFERKRYDDGLLDLSYFENKYSKEKIEEERIKRLKKAEKQLEKLCEQKWIEMPIVKSLEGTDSIVIFTGKANKEERERVIKETNDGKIKIILTTQILDKAISINCLNILFLLFSTRERASTTQRVGRISRTFEGKTQPIVYDVIYDHYMSFYQFYNNKGDCRMTAYQGGFVKAHPSINLFIEYLKCRFRQMPMYPSLQKEWEKYYNSYVIELNQKRD